MAIGFTILDVMEDNRTQDALDELADLFLTGISTGGHTAAESSRGGSDGLTEVSEQRSDAEKASVDVAVRGAGEEAETMAKETEAEIVGVEATGGVPQPRYGAGGSGMVKLRPKPATGQRDKGSVIRVPGGQNGHGAVEAEQETEQVKQERSGAERMSALVAGVAPVAGNEKRDSVAGRIGGDELLEDVIGEALDAATEVVSEVEAEVADANDGAEDMVFGLVGQKLDNLNSADVLAEDMAHKQAQLNELHEELQRADEQAGLLDGKIEMGGVMEEEDNKVALDQEQYELEGEQVLEIVSEDEIENEGVVVAERYELDEEEGRVDEEDEVVSGAYVEAVFLGNLPGVSGPWLTQYAQLVAQEEGAVALLHVDDGQIDVELIEPIDAGRRGLVAREPRRVKAKEAEGADLVAVLDELVTMPRPVRTILVHLDEGVDAKAFERGALIDDVTMCCGADDMAVMSVIQKLRNLAEADPMRIAQKQVGLMIMGSDEEHSRSAAAKICSQMTGELGCDVQLAGWQQQMVPVSVSQLGSYLDTASQWENVREYLMGLTLPGAMEEEVEMIEVSDTQPYDGHYSEAGPIEAAMMLEEKEAREETPVAVPVIGERQELADEREDGELTDAEAAALFAEEVKAELAEAEEADVVSEEEELIAAGHENVTVEKRRESLFSETTGRERGTVLAASSAAEPTETPRVQEVISEGTLGDTGGDVPPPRIVAEVVREEVKQPKAVEVAEPIEVKVVHEPRVEAKTEVKEPADMAEEFTLGEIVTGMNGVLAGGTMLDAFCPKRPEVELVLDQSGGLHLLGMHDSASSVQVAHVDQQRQIDEAGLQQTVMDLLEVKQWAEEHAAILAMTQRQLRFAKDQPAKLHLFTDRADLATKLITRFEGDLKLHLLQIIEVGDDSTVFCTPLN